LPTREVSKNTDDRGTPCTPVVARGSPVDDVRLGRMVVPTVVRP
jgi:hypothetical protein